MTLPVFRTLSEGLDLVKQNPVLFIPALTITAISFLVQFAYPYPPDTYDPTTMVLSLLVSAVSSLFSLVVIMMSYDGIRRKKISFMNALKASIPKIIPMLLASILMSAIVFAGLLLLIVPGIFVAVRLSFYEFAILLDNAGVVDSLKRSWKITRGNWWRIVGLSLLVILVFMPVMVFNLLGAFNLGLFSVIGNILSALFVTWATATLTVAYTKLRKR